MSHKRIRLEDTLESAISKLCGGNPGALRVLIDLYKRAQQIDPDSALGGLGPLLLLDSFAVYGPRIWMLYKDVCSEDYVRMLGVLRAVQLGIISEAALNNAIDNHGMGFDIEETLKAVGERLPKFGGVFATEAASESEINPIGS